MTDVSTSIETLQVKNQPCSKLVRWLISAVVCLIFLIVAMALAIVFSRDRIPKRSDDWIKSITEMPQESRRSFTKISNYPFMAALVSSKPDLFLCSCVILNGRYLLTAANCLSVLFPHLWVRIGTSTWDSDGELHEVERFTIHYNYTTKTFDNNLAVVRTKTEMIFNEFSQPVELISRNMSHVNGTLVGWGNICVFKFFPVRLFKKNEIVDCLDRKHKVKFHVEL